MQETWVLSLGWEDPLEKEMATHSSTLAWKMPWMEEPGRLQSMGSQRVRHDWATSLHKIKDFNGGSAEKNPPANAGDRGSIPESGRSPRRRNGNPLQYSCLANPMDRRSWWAPVHGVTKDAIQQLNNKGSKLPPQLSKATEERRCLSCMKFLWEVKLRFILASSWEWMAALEMLLGDTAMLCVPQRLQETRGDQGSGCSWISISTGAKWQLFTNFHHFQHTFSFCKEKNVSL